MVILVEGESKAYERPQRVAEAMLATLWCNMLNMERIGRHDNFFLLGGTSLLAVQMLERLSKAGFILPPVPYSGRQL